MPHVDKAFQIKKLFERLIDHAPDHLEPQARRKEAAKAMDDRVGPLWRLFAKLDGPNVPAEVERKLLDRVREVMIEENLEPGALINKAGLDRGPPTQPVGDTLQERIQISIERGSRHG